MSNYLGEISEISKLYIETTEKKKITLDEYHRNLPFRKGDIILLSGKKLLFMIPRDRFQIIEMIKNPITGLAPVFANLIISESEKFIVKDHYSPAIPKEKMLSSFFNMVVWKEHYFCHRGKFLSSILKDLVPKEQVNKFIKYWLEEHLLRQFQLWGLSPEQTKILIEDISIAETGQIDIEDFIVMISKYPGRFLYTHPDIGPEKIRHLTQIFDANPIPSSIERIKRSLHYSEDSYIEFTEEHRKSLDKHILSLGSYGIKVYDHNTKVCNISTYKLESYVCNSIAPKIKRCNYDWRDSKDSFKLRLTHGNLSEEQRDGLIMAFMNPISIFTGGPGCGKTILVKALINEALSRGIPYHVAAFTGKAVSRVKEAAYPDSIESSTIDMMLTQGPSHYKFNLLILEEASMITTKHMYRLFRKFNPIGYNIVLVGDLDQIPPIDKGHFFSSLIWSKRIPYIRLTKNFRVDSVLGGDIIRNASMIVDPSRDLRQPIDLDIKSNSFNILRGDIKAINTILKTFDKSHLDSLTIMTPYNKEVDSINKLFQDIKYDIDTRCLYDKGNKWYKTDRIMITKNDTAENLANGDLGTIMDIDHQRNKIEVAMDKDENRRIFNPSKFSMLKHSYCFTINKSQGSEYDAVILYLPNSEFNDLLLNANMIYTAITRARKMVWIIVEDPNILIKACSKRIPVNSDILKDSLIAKFPKEYIGTLVEYYVPDYESEDCFDDWE